MESEVDIFGDFASPCGNFTLTFDDDSKVAYAYLKNEDRILGDVWVYNRCDAPEQPEWEDRDNLPFANCKEYVVAFIIKKPIKLSDVEVKWNYSDGQPTALVYLFGDLAASVGVDDRPGYSRFASKDGPLAKVMTQAGRIR